MTDNPAYPDSLDEVLEVLRKRHVEVTAASHNVADMVSKALSLGATPTQIRLALRHDR